jgi:uracil-DNA glycosylase
MAEDNVKGRPRRRASRFGNHADRAKPGPRRGQTGQALCRPRSGKYLDQVLSKNNLDRSKLYVTSVVKQTTPRNRKPTAEEIEYWMPYLLQEIEKVKPKTIVLMGTVAWRTPRLQGIDYMETYHPAAAMRFPGVRVRFERDLERLGERASQLQR